MQKERERNEAVSLRGETLIVVVDDRFAVCKLTGLLCVRGAKVLIVSGKGLDWLRNDAIVPPWNNGEPNPLQLRVNASIARYTYGIYIYNIVARCFRDVDDTRD